MKNKRLILTYFIGLILVFNAGWVDSVVLYKSFGASVAAMTGNYRILGHAFAESQNAFAFEVILLVIGFIIGAAINGMILQKNNPYRISKNHISSLVIQSGIILLGAILLDIYRDKKVIDDLFLAMSMGMQNSFTSLFFGGFARTTHMTGTTTDFGIEIGKYIRGNRKDIWKIPFFGIFIIMFAFGNFAGATWVKISGDLFISMLFPSVLLPILTAMFLFMMLKYLRKNNKEL